MSPSIKYCNVPRCKNTTTKTPENLFFYVPKDAIYHKKTIFIKLQKIVDWSPFLEHVKEGWELRNHPNVLFLFYEDLIKDMPGCLRRVAKFFGKQYTEVQFAALADHLHIDNFKKNASVDLQNLREAGVFDGEFVRKGQSKGWTEYLDKEMQARMNKWLEEGLRGSTLRFPTQ